MKKSRILPLLIVLFLALSAIPTYDAAAPSAIYIGGSKIAPDLSGALIDGTSYLPLKAVADYFGGRLTWNQATRTARYKTTGLEITAVSGSNYILANGRALYAEKGIFIQNGRIMVPSRLVAQSVNGSAQWDAKSRTVRISVGGGFIERGESYYDADKLYWLSRIISSESQGEPLAGQIAVGNVVLNRVKSPKYPNTIYGVIFDRNYGVQFEPVLNGTIYNTPADISVVAAKLCLEGVDLSRGSIYFYNPAIAQSNWIGNNRTYVMTIGVHKFYI